MCPFTMWLCHSAHKRVESISTLLEFRVSSLLVSPVEYDARRSLSLKRSWNFCYFSFRIHLSWKETRAKQPKMRNHTKRGKAPGRLRCPANIQNQSPRYVSEAILDSLAQAKPPQPTSGETETRHPHWALPEFLTHKIIDNKMLVVWSH